MAKQTAINELTSYAIENINEWIAYKTELNGDEIHQRLFNEDYYTIGRYEAEQDLQRWEGIFNCIEAVKEYEQDNFGEVSTDLSEPEKVVNMYVYILGEEILNDAGVDNNKFYSTDDLKELVESLKGVKHGQ